MLDTLHITATYLLDDYRFPCMGGIVRGREGTAVDGVVYDTQANTRKASQVLCTFFLFDMVRAKFIICCVPISVKSLGLSH